MVEDRSRPELHDLDALIFPVILIDEETGVMTARSQREMRECTAYGFESCSFVGEEVFDSAGNLFTVRMARVVFDPGGSSPDRTVVLSYELEGPVPVSWEAVKDRLRQHPDLERHAAIIESMSEFGDLIAFLERRFPWAG